MARRPSRRCASTSPDIVVLDFNVPRLFSLELVRKIQAMPNPPLTVILSARGDRKQVSSVCGRASTLLC